MNTLEQTYTLLADNDLVQTAEQFSKTGLVKTKAGLLTHIAKAEILALMLHSTHCVKLASTSRCLHQKYSS